MRRRRSYAGETQVLIGSVDDEVGVTLREADDKGVRLFRVGRSIGVDNDEGRERGATDPNGKATTSSPRRSAEPCDGCLNGEASSETRVGDGCSEILLLVMPPTKVSSSSSSCPITRGSSEWAELVRLQHRSGAKSSTDMRISYHVSVYKNEIV